MATGMAEMSVRAVRKKYGEETERGLLLPLGQGRPELWEPKIKIGDLKGELGTNSIRVWKREESRTWVSGWC